MKKLRVMDSTGDTAIEFDETEACASEAHMEAKALFERLTSKGAAVFAVNRAEGAPDKRVTNFNDLERENVVVPLIVSG